MSLSLLMNLTEVPPNEDPLVFRLKGGYLNIGPTFSCTCTWKS
jgi:hypothetical protein